MSKASTLPLNLARREPSARMLDTCAWIPVLVFTYVEIVSPLLNYRPIGRVTAVSVADRLQDLATPHLENKIVWPALVTIALFLVLRNWSRLALPSHIKWLFAYLGFAGISVFWAFSPELSFTRYVLQLTIVTSIVLPALLAARTADIIRGVFLCFAFATILNICFVLNQTPVFWDNEVFGYPGYFGGKGALGECAAIAFLLSLHEMLYPGWRRAFSIVVAGIAVYLMIVSQSKGSLGLSLLAPFMAGLTLLAARKMRISAAAVLLPIPICYFVLARIVGNLINRISWYLYGNYTLSGRTYIWDFANAEIARKPLLGWGYQSFWLVGPDAPSVVDAPGWIKAMPHAHNGYLDTMLDMGYVGLAFLVIFILTTVYAIGRLADREPARAWLLLSLALFIILTNFLESIWMHGMDMPWLIFVIVAAEAGRHRQLSHAGAPKPPLRGPVIAGPRPGRVRGRPTELAHFR